MSNEMQYRELMKRDNIVAGTISSTGHNNCTDQNTCTTIFKYLPLGITNPTSLNICL